MQLWSGVLSPFSAKVRIYLAEKGIAADVREIPWSRKTLWGPKPAAFLEASPRGEVPALVDGDLAIFDSTIIIEYLEELEREPALRPADAAGRARCRMWEEMADHYLATRVTTLIRETFMKPDGQGRDGAAVDEALTDFAGYCTALDRALAGAEHLCGDFTVADIATWVCLAFARTLGVSLETYPKTSTWFERVGARPAVQAEFQQIMTAAAAA